MKRIHKRKRRRITMLSGIIIFLTLSYICIFSVVFIGNRWKRCDLNPSQKKISMLMKKTDTYPKDLLEMLSKNPDMLSFVEGYPEKKGQVYADNIGPVTKGEFPLLLQWDERWGYGTYGNNCIAVNGCAPTVISMALAGLTGDNSVTPYHVAQYADENGYYVPGSGSSWSLISEGISHFGLIGTELPLSKAFIFDTLKAGNPIICSMRPGDFTTTGHFILLTGIEDGKIKVNDPNSRKRSDFLWDFETLENQINNLWAISR